MSSNTEFAVPVAALQYRDIGGNAPSEETYPADMDERLVYSSGSRVIKGETPEAELTARIVRERAEAAAQAEKKLRQETEQKLLAGRSAIAASIREFAEQRNEYFARVEAEIVQLSLSIAAKILHREAQVDPMLVATLVRMAVERMREESSVAVRVAPGRVAAWRQYFAEQPNMGRVEVVEDAQLTSQDCVLETELGSANFGLDTQLKEVEQGFFDLLALRPNNK